MHSRAFPCIPRILQDWSTSHNGNYERSQFWTFPAIRLLKKGKKSASALEKEVAHQISPLILSTPNPDYTCPTPSRPRMTVRKNKKEITGKGEYPLVPSRPSLTMNRRHLSYNCFPSHDKAIKSRQGVTPLRCYSPMTCCTEGGVWHARSKSSPTINHSLLSTCL